MNKWLYSHGNPILLTDPSGNDPYWCGNSRECYAQYLEIFKCVGYYTYPNNVPPRDVHEYHLSLQGETFIFHFEIREYFPYDDGTGTCTIGFGSVLFYPDNINYCSYDSVKERNDYKVIDKASKTQKTLNKIWGLSLADTM